MTIHNSYTIITFASLTKTKEGVMGFTLLVIGLALTALFFLGTGDTWPRLKK